MNRSAMMGSATLSASGPTGPVACSLLDRCKSSRTARVWVTAIKNMKAESKKIVLMKDWMSPWVLWRRRKTVYEDGKAEVHYNTDVVYDDHCRSSAHCSEQTMPHIHVARERP